MDAEEQMQAHDQREAVGMSAPAGRGHLVIHLRDSRGAKPAPRVHKMLAQQLGCLVAPLGGRDAPADERHGVHRIEAGDPSGAAEMARPTSLPARSRGEQVTQDFRPAPSPARPDNRLYPL